MATQSRKDNWRMSQNEIVRFALNNCKLEEQGVPDLNAPAAVATLQNAKPDRMDGGTESKPHAGYYETGELTTPRNPILLFDSVAAIEENTESQRSSAFPEAHREYYRVAPVFLP
ncbi:MAG: hypothetical protein RLZZ245_2303 [Verrucomicrobiota bacterium]